MLLSQTQPIIPNIKTRFHRQLFQIQAIIVNPNIIKMWSRQFRKTEITYHLSCISTTNAYYSADTSHSILSDTMTHNQQKMEPCEKNIYCLIFFSHCVAPWFFSEFLFLKKKTWFFQSGNPTKLTSPRVFLELPIIKIRLSVSDLSLSITFWIYYV